MRTVQRNGEPPVSVLGRGVALLHCFDGVDRRELSLAEITKLSGLPKPTVHRLLAELSELGMIERAPSGYRLGIQLFELGLRVERQISLQDVAMPGIQDLFEATRKTVHFAILDGVDVVYLGKFKGRDAPNLPTHVGGRMPAYCTAVGKVLLAHADRDAQRAVLESALTRRTRHTITAPGLLGRQFEAISKTGVGHDHEESAPGVACVASPIFDENNNAVAAVSITGRTTTFDAAKMGLAVRTAALGMTRALIRAKPASAADRRESAAL